jgi:hypothetical protein
MKPLHSAATATMSVLPEFEPVNGSEPDEAAAGSVVVGVAAATVKAQTWLLPLVTPTNVSVCDPAGRSDPTVNW